MRMSYFKNEEEEDICDICMSAAVVDRTDIFWTLENMFSPGAVSSVSNGLQKVDDDD